MAVESALASYALSYMNTPAMKKEQTAMAEALESAVASQSSRGDAVSISEAARELSKSLVNNPDEARAKASGSDDDSMINKIRKQIEELQEEIKEIEESNLPEKEKQKKLQEKEAQLMELTSQLDKLTGGGNAYYGGTRAEGAGNSASSF